MADRRPLNIAKEKVVKPDDWVSVMIDRCKEMGISPSAARHFTNSHNSVLLDLSGGRIRDTSVGKLFALAEGMNIEVVFRLKKPTNLRERVTKVKPVDRDEVEFPQSEPVMTVSPAYQKLLEEAEAEREEAVMAAVYADTSGVITPQMRADIKKMLAE